MKVPFIKMQGLGNDFVVIDSFLSGNKDLSHLQINAKQAQKICDRRWGVGADQILWIQRPQGQADARMEVLNSDGSSSGMCGNGLRAVVAYLHQLKESKTDWKIETPVGIHRTQISIENGKASVTVEMGEPRWGSQETLKKEPQGEELSLEKNSIVFYEVDFGNPHAVTFVDQWDGIHLPHLGPQIENHPRFPKRTNVEWVKILGKNEIEVKVWERGAGVTLACGSGACAAAATAISLGHVQSPLSVNLPGGRLEMTWKGLGNSLWMKGPAEIVFRGEFKLPSS